MPIKNAYALCMQIIIAAGLLAIATA